MNNLELSKQSISNFMKVVNHEKPNYIPRLGYNSGASLAYSGVTYWDVEKDEKKFSEVMGRIYNDLKADIAAVNRVFVAARADEILEGHVETKLAKDGMTVQHVQNPMMKEDEYDLLINDMDNFVNNTLLPRKYPFLFNGCANKAVKAVEDTLKEVLNCYSIGPQSKTDNYILNTYGIPSIVDFRYVLYTPGDIIFDNLRGFTGTLTDIRRHLPQFIEACDVLWEKRCNHFENTRLLEDAYVQYPAHLPPYLTPKQYEKICLPYFKTQVENISKAGSKVYVVLEGNCAHLLDYFLDFPKDSMLLNVDDDDIFEVSKKIGHHQIIIGGAKLAKLRLESKEENINYAKRVIDECARDSGFIFGTDKAWICPGDINQNMIDVYDFVEEYGRY